MALPLCGHPAHGIQKRLVQEGMGRPKPTETKSYYTYELTKQHESTANLPATVAWQKCQKAYSDVVRSTPQQSAPCAEQLRRATTRESRTDEAC